MVQPLSPLQPRRPSVPGLLHPHCYRQSISCPRHQMPVPVGCAAQKQRGSTHCHRVRSEKWNPCEAPRGWFLPDAQHGLLDPLWRNKDAHQVPSSIRACHDRQRQCAPESVMQSLPLFGNTVCIIVLQEPQVRDAGEPHLIAAGQDASCHPRDQ